ncbi:MAG: hypothetical protein ACOX4H_11690 [Bacillota bacterium]|jgi:hypothetical protein|nr:hypothetical protein [Clostridia bacterium]
MEHISAEVLNAVKEAAEDGKLTCVKAHHIGEKLNISLAIIGEAANQLGIKITKCQLGCF